MFTAARIHHIVLYKFVFVCFFFFSLSLSSIVCTGIEDNFDPLYVDILFLNFKNTTITICVRCTCTIMQKYVCIKNEIRRRWPVTNAYTVLNLNEFVTNIRTARVNNWSNINSVHF